MRADIDAGEFINEPAVVGLGLAEEQGLDPYIGQQIDAYKIDSLAQALLGFSTILLRQNETDKAVEAAQEAIALLEITKRKDQTDIFIKAFLAKGYAQLGECQFFLAESSKELTRKHQYFTAANEWFRKSSDVWLSLKDNMVLAKYYERESFAATNRIDACETALAKVQRQ